MTAFGATLSSVRRGPRSGLDPKVEFELALTSLQIARRTRPKRLGPLGVERREPRQHAPDMAAGPVQPAAARAHAQWAARGPRTRRHLAGRLGRGRREP